MRRWVVWWLAALSGCAAQVSERYRVDGTTEELLVAARATAHQLGWATEDAANGQFRITDYPRHTPGQSLRVRAIDGALLIDGGAASRAAVEMIAFRLPEAAEVLARGTDARLHGLAGQPATPRSKAIAIGLDLLLPAVGAVYALGGDPYYDSASVGFSRRYGWDVLLRAEMDAICVGLAIENHVLSARGTQVVGPFLMLLPVVVAVLTRALSIATDWFELDYRNAYAVSGLPNPDPSYQPRVQYSIADGSLP